MSKKETKLNLKINKKLNLYRPTLLNKISKNNLLLIKLSKHVKKISKIYK